MLYEKGIVYFLVWESGKGCFVNQREGRRYGRAICRNMFCRYIPVSLSRSWLAFVFDILGCVLSGKVVGLEELYAEGVLLPEDLRLALFDEDLQRLDHQLAVESVKVCPR